jgi:uncharacterized protein (DUF885 family)
VSARAQGGAPAARLRALADRVWAWELREDPIAATQAGVYDYDDRLPRVEAADQRRRADTLALFRRELAAIDRAGLAGGDVVTAEMLELRLRESSEEIERQTIRVPILADEGFHTSIASLPRVTPARSADDVERYARRLAQVPRYFREHIAWMRKGVAEGVTMPRVVLDGYETSTTAADAAPRETPFWAPVAALPASVPEAERRRVAALVERVVVDSVRPAYAAFRKFIVEEYRPRARQTLGARSLPDGEAYYRWRVRSYTTLPLEPDSVHALGLREVARIRAGMDSARQRAGFKGDHAGFLKFLRTDPRFYAKTPEELLAHASFIAKRMDYKLPSLFGRLPRQPYGVVPVPAHLAPKYTAGRYSGAPITGARAGEYWVNTYDLPSRPLYNLEALTLHEGVPGHHLQTALAQELGDLPDFRRHSYLSAFGEGWGLYSEHLGREAGFYTDPYSDFGRLTYEMWRACRLVVDTGIHWKGWTRQQAIDYMASNTALPLREVTTEVDRYISWPGQALAYKIGELEIKSLRAEAERALGDRFDIRAFHDVVLKNGSIPLPTLRREVRAWIAATAKTGA